MAIGFEHGIWSDSRESDKWYRIRDMAKLILDNPTLTIDLSKLDADEISHLRTCLREEREKRARRR